MKDVSDHENRAIRRTWAPLLPAALLAPFANGTDAIGIAAWLFPLFLLRFVRVSRPALGLPIAWVLLTAAFAFQFRGAAPLSGWAYLAFVAGFGAVFLASYVVDRLLTPRLSGSARALVFPCALVTVDYLLSHGDPYGTWGALPYSQSGDLPLMQLLAVTGIWGISFLIGWFAAACNDVWENGLRRATTIFWTCAATIVVIFLAGGLRLAILPPKAATVRVASFSVAAPAGAGDYWSSAARTDDALLRRAQTEMRAGARIVFWSEANAPVKKSAEAAFIAQGQALAAAYHAYLGMSLFVIHVDSHPARFENVLILIGPDGRVAWTYHKAKPVPGTAEYALMIRGHGRTPVVDTPYGRISGLICFDADFPWLVAGAGEQRADIVLDPSQDWQAIDPVHTEMASFRAVEQGVNLVRQTGNGLSAAYDYEGHVLARTDYFRAADRTMVAQLPTEGVRTFYGRFGDWFAWLGMAGLCVLVLAWGVGAGRRS